MATTTTTTTTTSSSTPLNTNPTQQQQQQSPPIISPTRLTYLLEMRRRFCAPEMLVDITSAELNFDYFKPKALPSSAWTEDDDAALMKALLLLPFGKWTSIRKDYLPKRDENELRIRCMQLLGVQNLTKYEGWKPKSKEEIDSEREKNLNEAMEKNIELVDGVVPDPTFGNLVDKQENKVLIVKKQQQHDDEEDEEEDDEEPTTKSSSRSKRARKE